jgi:dTDP-4-amino-4,6-dideoxygalactose transaminase
MLGLKGVDRARVFDHLREQGLGVNVHYIPVHLQPYYMDHFGTSDGDFPMAEAYYERVITLPLYPGMTHDDVEYVIAAVKGAVIGGGL